MNPFGLFQGFGQMSRSDFRAPGSPPPSYNRGGPKGTGVPGSYAGGGPRGGLAAVGGALAGSSGGNSARPAASPPPSYNRGGPKGTGVPGPYAGGRGNGNAGPQGARPTGRVASLPADYGYQERLLSKQADNSRIAPPAAVPSRGLNPYGGNRGNGNVDPYGVGPAQRPGSRQPGRVPVPAPPLAAAQPGAVTRGPVYSRPTADIGDQPERDYLVPAGQAPMPVAPQRPPAGSTASRANAVMAPLGASRNEALVQAAGNAGMRLADPASFKMFAGNGVMPATSEGMSRQMLSEFGSDRPSLLEPSGRVAPGAGNAGMQLAGPAAYEAFAGNGVMPATSEGMSRQMLSEFGSDRPSLLEPSRGIGSVALSPETLAASAGAYSPEATGGDRFSHLRPDLAAWARSNQGAAKGVDGMNIVDRFMAKQGAAPLASPANFPQAMAVDPVHSYTSPGALATTGANIGRSAEAQALDSNAFERPAAVSTAMAFDPSTNLVDQVQMLRETYRNNSRPNPGVASPLFWN